MNSCTLETAVLLFQREESGLWIDEGLSCSLKQLEAWEALCRVRGVKLETATGFAHAIQTKPLGDDAKLVGYGREFEEEVLSKKRFFRRSREPEDLDLWRVPQRHAVLLSIAFSAAETLGEKLTLGYWPRFPVSQDASRETLAQMIALLQRSAFTPVAVETPFWDTSYLAILEAGKKSKCPFERVWTCLNHLERLCGVCSSCLHRRAAFSHLSWPDPAKYHDWGKGGFG